MRRVLVVAVVACLLLPPGSLPAQTQEGTPPIVERVEILNNRYLQKETLLFYISTKPGDRYDPEKLKRDFRRLWDTGFLDDLAVEVIDGPEGGAVVRFRVAERKRIQIVDFRGSKELSTSNIEDALKENDAEIRIDTFYDPAKARRVESIIKTMLMAKGRPFGEVTHEAKNIGGSGQQLSFLITDGPRAKIQEIEFDGNKVFSDGQLRGVLKKLKPSGVVNLSWLGGKTTYTEEKWLGGGDDPQGDRGRLEDYYLDHGYVTVDIGQPRIEYSDGKSGWFKKKPVKWMKLVIPVDEGDQYRLGDLSFEGLTVLKEEFVRDYIKLQTGEIYNESKFKKAYEKLRDLYGTLGYFQWTGVTQRDPDPERKVVDVVVRMEEDLQYYVGQISFVGNDTTKDKVIRREIFLNENSVFNTEALKLSIQRINQLGYFKQMEGAPDIRPNPSAEDKVDITFKVEEQNRNQFTFGGGVSGLEGTFINGSFSTTNFLGAGETFSVYVQSGRRTKNYSLSVSEPYFLDRPITAGADVFKRKITYLSYGNVSGFSQETTGFSVTAGRHVGKWSRAFLNYAYEIIKISEVDPSDFNDSYYYGYGSYGGIYGPQIDASLFGDFGQRRESRITPNIVYNTVDNPWTPRAGMRHTATLQIAGGPLGGTVDYFRPNVEAITYIPHTRRTSLGLRAQAAWILPYSDTRVLPWYQRYFLGGETQVRGYRIRSIGPTDSTGRALGGNKFLLLNAEYYLDVFGPLRMLAFFDAGQAYLEDARFDLKEMRVSYGVEARFVMPVLNVPFRLIYAWNPNRSNQEKLYIPARTFKFAVGTTF
ncbi:MAG: outer membrane protein assembly factor BamA [Acidobacteria bacterium]|nr:outer membrane protein assembly factor BamA [Acidobacteriota bacterium]